MPPPSKRRKTSAVQEVVFDTAARQEYLTGFHKRKVARVKHAQEIAVKREKEEKRRERNELRKQRQQNLEDHVKAVNDSMKILNGEEGESEEVEEGEKEDNEQWAGFGSEPQASGQDEEYVDEDQYATVTVEAVDITRDGMEAHGDSEEEEDDEKNGEENDPKNATEEEASKPESQTKQKKPWSKNKPAGDKPKRKKSRNFKYESKEDRKMNRARDRAKHKAHATARKSRKS